MICIVCPKGCHLQVQEDGDHAVSGNSCEKGAEYGKNELLNPMRMLTSTVKIESKAYHRLPVKTSSAIEKGKLFEAMKLINRVQVKAPVSAGDVILDHILGTSISIIATKDILE